MRAATCSVGLVSPRSTWESIGAETPERAARSRSERSIASRSARTRGPMAAKRFDGGRHTNVRYHVQRYRDARIGNARAWPPQPLMHPSRSPRRRSGRSTERDLPEAPPLRRIIGPSVILVGVGIASGEYILFPYIASQVGLVFLWAAIVGLLTQYFINMEIERYTLATGETAITGFQRLWRPLGLVMVVCAILPNMWPAWAISAATITTFLFGGGNANAIAIVAMILIGIALSASPVVYQTIEKLEFVKVALVLVFVVVALTTAVSADGVRRRRPDRHQLRQLPGGEIELAVLLGALAYAGAGGTNNLVQSATGSATRATAWASTRRAWSRRSPATRRRRRRARATCSRSNAEQHGPLARLVAQGQHRAVRLLLRDRRDHASPSSRCVAYSTVYGRPGGQGATTSTSSRSRATSSRTRSAPGSARCSG